MYITKLKFNLFSRKKKFTCGCGKNFNTQEELVRHSQIEHSGTTKS
jgi:hypothetical protein